MGTDPKDKLESPEEVERMGQEMDQLLATTRRPLAEMQELTERAKALSRQREQIVKNAKRRKS